MKQRDPNEQIFDEELDDDSPEWTVDDFRNARPAEEVSPRIVEEYRRGRGPQKMPTKQLIHIRLSRDVVATYKATGEGWQSRMDEDLRRLANDRAAAAMTVTLTVGGNPLDDAGMEDVATTGSRVSIEHVEPDVSTERKRAG